MNIDSGKKKDSIVTVSLAIFCQSFQALTIGGIALFLPLIRHDLVLSFTQGGMLSAVTTFVYAIMQIPSGFLADRYGPKRIFFIGVLGTTVLSLAFGLVTEYWQAVANQAFSGFFRALLFAPGLTLVAGWFPPQRRATAMSLYLAGGFAGNVVLDIVGPLLVNEFGWRFPFIVFSAFGIIASFVLLHFSKESPSIDRDHKVSVSEVLYLFRYRVMWFCGGIQYIRLAIMQGITFWLPSLLVDEKGLTLQITGLIIALRAALIIPSNIIGGYVSDRLKNPILIIALALLILAATNSLLVMVNNIPLLIAIVVINSLFVQMYFGPLFAIPVEFLGAKKAGITAGFSNFFANVGAFSFTYLLGVLKDETGIFQSGFYTTTGAALFGIVLTILLGRIRSQMLERQVQQPSP